jgi:alanine-synthesizing transaminase
MPSFSHRTEWHRQHNDLTAAYEARRKSGVPIDDLTISNPTECGFDYPPTILNRLSDPVSLTYLPDPRGLISARTVIARLIKNDGCPIEGSNIFITASTSESYSLIFKLLCDPGDSLLVPVPSYPLFEYLASASDIKLRTYGLLYDHGWYIDIGSLRAAYDESTRAIILIHPHNPTGMFVKKSEFREIISFAKECEIAIISDEVFRQFPAGRNPEQLGTLAGSSGCLTFTLDGLSKMCALPQLKLGWFTVTGRSEDVREASDRLEILADTFLSANTPVQHALPSLLKAGKNLREQISARIKQNVTMLKKLIGTGSKTTLLDYEGGWYGVLQVPATRSDEVWAMELLKYCGVFLFPGYFFDFRDKALLVISLIVPSDIFSHGATRAIKYIEQVDRG